MVKIPEMLPEIDFEQSVIDFESYPIVSSVNKSRNAFLLITLYRSGSTLTGEMFNKNAKFLYYFEPLGKIPNQLNDHVDCHGTVKFENFSKGIFGDENLTEMKVKMLNDSFHCIPPLANQYANVAPKSNPVAHNCLNDGICFWYMSKRTEMTSSINESNHF